MPYKLPEVRRKKEKEKRLARRKAINKILGNRCVRCESLKSLEVDHINRDRDFCIGSSLNWNWDKITKELKKCQLLCRSCHVKKTIKERGRRMSTHGMASMYCNQKCRCEPCKNAWSVYMKTRRAKISPNLT